MSDTEDQEFDESFKGFGEDPAPVTPPVVVEPPKEEPKKDDKPVTEEVTETIIETPAADKLKEKETPAKVEPPVTDEAANKPKEEGTEPPKAPETPPTPEVPQSLTKDDVKSVVSDLLNTERSSSKELETTTQEVLEAFYPDGLSNTLVDERSGKKLETPADVVQASDGQMTIEEAAQWLLNEQYKLDQSVTKIKDEARRIAETTVSFKRDAVSAVQKYEPLFKAYPVLQQKVWDKLMKQVKVDKDRGVILSSPDVMEHYDDYLEPYQQAYEFGSQKPATNPTPNPVEPPKPTAEDRMDEGGDGGASDEVDDPNDFAQQVSKELKKGP